ncbi:hypothetical protein VTO42DRAFT_2453 [Malbranchea cinnamomea]
MSSLKVLCRDNPRLLALVANEHVLLLQHTPTTADSLSAGSFANVYSAQCIVRWASCSSLNLSAYRSLGHGQGTLGLIDLSGDIFLVVITSSSLVATVKPGETVRRIDSVDFYCLNSRRYDLVGDSTSRIDEDSDYGTAYEGRDFVAENPFLALKKLLSDGSFYYSTDFNLTNRLQERADDPVAFDIDSLDEGFLWNSYLIHPLLQFRKSLTDHDRQILDSSRILTSVIRGFVQSLTIPASVPLLPDLHSNLPSTLTVISRLSSRKAGTRFNARGIDDDGNVANFVETETVLWMPDGRCFSYTQVRGSVPIFWEQSPSLLSTQKISVTRSLGATQPSFDKHFGDLATDYGAVHVINLMSEARPQEEQLSQRFRHHIERSPLHQSEHRLLRHTHFDFLAEASETYEHAIRIWPRIRDSADAFVYFLSQESPSTNGSSKSLEDADDVRNRPTVILQQEGVFRTNCLDCLDRTNIIQTLLSKIALETFFHQYGGSGHPYFWRYHGTLWADNGDNLSKIYAGTGALKTSFNRHGKMSLAGTIADVRKSATRLYVNHFVDKDRQKTIDLLLGLLSTQAAVHLYDPINDAVNAALRQRAAEYTSTKKIRIWTGTFNLNGKSHGASADLSPWLLGHLEQSREEPALVAVGFQEIVELSPQQIMSTDPNARRLWEEAVSRTLNKYAEQRGTSRYLHLRSGQLVGAALLVFAREDVVNEIKNVEGSVKKTGMSGIAGNKGGCAIRLEFANSRICFVTAHLAAGFGNYDMRNKDYETISSGLRFPRNKAISDHDSIIWLGDFNYRIELANDHVRKLIEVGDLETLYDHDQLNLQMVAGYAFPFYNEGRITFPPTYKYDNGTDNYDTSEKARIPAWCDRILWRGSNLRQLQYNTAPLRFSDHRPVYAVFECDISVIDKRLEEELRKELYNRERTAVGSANPIAATVDSDEGDSRHFKPIAPGLPPASSDKHKWWLDNGRPARSTVRPPQPGYVLNPKRRANPFASPGSTESDWVHVDQLESPNASPASQQQQTRATRRKPVPPPPPPSRPVQTGTLIDVDTGKENLANSHSSTSSSRHPPPPPPPSRSNTSVSGAQTNKAKKPPPVPKKPSTLAGNRVEIDLLSDEPDGGVSLNQPAEPPRGAMADVFKPPPPLPTRKPTIQQEDGITGRFNELRSIYENRGAPQSRPARRPACGHGGVPQDGGGVSLGTSTATPLTLSPPPRRASPVPVRGEREITQRNKRDDALLDGDGGEGLVGWKALRPQS